MKAPEHVGTHKSKADPGIFIWISTVYVCKLAHSDTQPHAVISLLTCQATKSNKRWLEEAQLSANKTLRFAFIMEIPSRVSFYSGPSICLFFCSQLFSSRLIFPRLVFFPSALLHPHLYLPHNLYFLFFALYSCPLFMLFFYTPPISSLPPLFFSLHLLSFLSLFFSSLLPCLIFIRLFHPFGCLDEYLRTKSCQALFKKPEVFFHPPLFSMKWICVPNSSSALMKLQEAEIMR